MRCLYIPILAMALAVAACGDDGDSGGDIDAAVDPDAGGLVPQAPTQISMVASGGFEGPMDAVASPDGTMFYFTAHDTNASDPTSTAAVFSVSSSGGAVEVMVSGAPLEDPSGLLMSCDGTTLYVSDLGYQVDDAALAADQDKAAIYTLDVGTQALTPLTATGLGEAAGLAFNTDCSTLYVSGYTPDGDPAVFTLAPAGGTASILAQGAPLESPSGVYVDANDIAWVMDHRDSDQLGGVLWAIDDAGNVDPVVNELSISEPAGVSLVAGGQIAVIPSRDANGMGQLITVDTVSGQQTIVQAAGIVEPAGIRTAIGAPVMAVVDTDGDAIFRAE